MWLGVHRHHSIDAYAFPPRVFEKVALQYPHLSEPQIRDVERGLRDYFHICNIGPRRMIAMPSQVVDAAWHEFILFTKDYRNFCRRALGRFLDHTPAEGMRTPTIAQEGIRRAWRLSCDREGIDPFSPGRLPLLFALDADLAIPDGFHYSLDCGNTPGDVYCAGAIGCSTSCGDGDDGNGGDGNGNGGNGGCGGD